MTARDYWSNLDFELYSIDEAQTLDVYLRASRRPDEKAAISILYIFSILERFHWYLVNLFFNIWTTVQWVKSINVRTIVRITWKRQYLPCLMTPPVLRCARFYFRTAGLTSTTIDACRGWRYKEACSSLGSAVAIRMIPIKARALFPAS
jgi:hypothetical protein